MALDAVGNLYISDSGCHAVRRVTTEGTIHTVAGNGTPGFQGDGGPAVSAQLLTPTGILVDKSGNLYIADSQNGRIRKVTKDGAISTVAGNGTSGFSDDGDKAKAAQLANVQDIAMDSAGNLYIADTSNVRVRKVSPDGIISTVAGTGMRGLDPDGGAAISTRVSPNRLAIGPSDNLYISDLA